MQSPLIMQGQGPAVPRVGSDLSLQTQFCRLQDHSFLASGICPLVGEAGLEACAGFLVGGIGACPLVQLGLVSLVGRTMSRVCL